MEFFTKDAPEFDATDVETNKVMAALSYWLFFLPLVTCPKSEFGKHNANQSLMMLIISIVLNVVFAVLTRIPALGWLFFLVQGLVGLVLLAMYVICLVLTIQGKGVKLPFIGDVKVFK